MYHFTFALYYYRFVYFVRGFYSKYLSPTTLVPVKMIKSDIICRFIYNIADSLLKETILIFR